MDVPLTAIQSTAPWVLIAIAVIALVLAILIKKIVGKIIVLVLAAVLIFVGWQQRQHVIDFANGVKDDACGEINNRQLTLSYGSNGTQDVNDTVENWRNVSPCGN